MTSRLIVSIDSLSFPVSLSEAYLTISEHPYPSKNEKTIDPV